MELKVNDNIRITTDAYNFIVQESRIVKEDGKVKKDGTQQKKGDIVWEDQSYHGNLNDALKSLLAKGIRDFCEDFNECIAFINLVHKKIDEIKHVRSRTK